MELQAIEQSLTKQFAKRLRNPFVQAIQSYQMISAGDSIAVCISGGKDSMLLAKLLQHYQKYSPIPFSLQFLAMDPGYIPEVRKQIEENAKHLQIPVYFFETDVLRIAEHHAYEHPCFLCSKMRRGHLYAQAQKRGCNKIALGHHYDDAIETVLMGLLYGGQVQAMLPRLQSKNYSGMELIRPLYFIREQDVTAWTEFCGLTFSSCGCPAAKHKQDTKRAQIKQLIESLAAENPQIRANLFHAVQQVDVQKVLGWRIGKQEYHSFLDVFSSDVDA